VFLIKKRFFQNSLTKKVFSDSFYSLIFSLSNNISRLAIIALLTRYYTKDEFGLWVTITSIGAIIVTGDFGISNVLRNKLSQFVVQGEKGDSEARKHFLFSLYFFSGLSFLLIIIFSFYANFFPLEELFKTPNSNLQAIGKSTLIIIQIITLVGIPLGISSICSFSYHESRGISILNTCITALSMIIICIMVYLKANIFHIVIFYFILFPVLNIYITIKFIRKRKWSLMIPLDGFWRINFKFLTEGFPFFIVQILSAFLLNASTVLISSKVGLEQSSEYNLVQKLYLFAVIIYQSMFNPMWGGYAQAINEKNWSWCYNIFIKSILITIVIFSSLIIFMKYVGNYLLIILAGDKYNIDGNYFIIVGLGMLFYILWACVLTFQNSLGRMKGTMILLVILSVCIQIVFKLNFVSFSILSIGILMIIIFFILAIYSIIDGILLIKSKNKKNLNVS
jgi:O-antigen/teichoic acid export membrane protein